MIYFEYLADLLAEAMATDVVTSGNWKLHTNRKIYLEHAKSFPVVKAEMDAGFSLKVVWRRLGSPVLMLLGMFSFYWSTISCQ